MTRIDTVDQLDALPIGSVILDIDGDAWQKRDEGWDPAERHDPYLRLSAGYLPATVLHVPGRKIVQEAKADAWDEGKRVGRACELHACGLHGPKHGTNPYRDEAP